MNTQQMIEDTPEAWDERKLGADEDFVGVAPEIDAKIDTALGMQAISIRMPQDLLASLKALAQLHGIGYQPLIRQVLIRWVDGEVKHMLIQKVDEMRAAGQLPGEPAGDAPETPRKAA